MSHHTVLVTGATGYIARHLVLQLLDAGHAVVGSVRSLAAEGELRAALGAALAEPAALDRLRLVELNLNEDAGWDAAMAGVDVLMHTASPVPDGSAAPTADYIPTAVDGTLRAVKAAYAAGVRRIIVTSSVAAIMGAPGHEDGQEFDESDWSDVDRPNLNAYTVSKTRAERALWDWNETEAPDALVTAINPAFVMGPPIGTRSVPSSLNIVARMLTGKIPMLPDIGFPYVDVRDVALMHVRAMDLPETAGKRYAASEQVLSFQALADMLRQDFPDRDLPTRMAPKLLLKVVSWFKPEMRAIAANLGRHDQISNKRARADMQLDFADASVAIRDSAAFLVEHRMLDDN